MYQSNDIKEKKFICLNFKNQCSHREKKTEKKFLVINRNIRDIKISFFPFKTVATTRRIF